MSTHNNKAPIKDTATNGSSKTDRVFDIKDMPPAVPETPTVVYVLLLIIIVITCTTFPVPFHAVGEPTIRHVFYYGWLTAVSTGFGVVPLCIVPNLAEYWIGISNAIAAGMMIAASYSLIVEGCTFREPHNFDVSSEVRTGLGVLAGVGFLLATKSILDKYEDLKVAGLGGTDARKALLMFFVMTLHSFSEGVGIGVSFGGAHGSDLGLFISASLAVHNVPEGLAMAVVLLPQKTPKLSAAIWAIFTSLPQPLMAVPAYLFVHHFIPILPVGLGFAGGAMAWVAVFELLSEAIEESNLLTTACVSAISMSGMLVLQGAIDVGARS